MTQEELKAAIIRLENLVRTSHNDEAKTLALELINLPVMREDPASKGIVKNYLGNIYRNLSDFPKALTYHESALHLFEEHGNREGIARSLGNIGIVFYHLSDHPKALDYYIKSNKIHEEIGNKLGMANTLANIGNVYWNLADYTKSLEYLEHALKIHQEIENKTGISICLMNIGNIFNNQLEYSKALTYYNKALNFDKEIGDKIGIAANVSNIGIVYQRLQDYPQALKNFEEALKVNEEIKNDFGIALILGNIGLVHGYLSNYPKSLEYLQLAHTLSQKLGTKFIVMDTLKHFSEVYEKMGEIETAFAYYKQYITLEKDIQSEESTNKARLFDQQRKIEESRKTHQLKLARFQEQERIFHKILPISIADRLIEGEQTIAESFENVSIFFSDIVDFTALSSTISAKELVSGLNLIFSEFDRIAAKHGIEKIKTIGDAYMAACGVPDKYEDHAIRMAAFAMEVCDFISTYKIGKNQYKVSIRIGLHCGEVVAGIIGENKFAYDLWGDSVNTASRMESHGQAAKIHISEDFKQALGNDYIYEERGEIDVKGKGKMKTYFLKRK